MARILIADEISQKGVEILSGALDVSYQPDITPEELLEIIPVYDALLVRSRTLVTAEVIRRGSELKVIGRAGVGVDNIDLPVATECGVLVLNSPEGNTASAAEHTLALMLSLARGVPAADRSVKSGKWERNKFVGCELFNKTLGVLGLGKIGSRVATAAHAMGMKVLVYDPLVTSDKVAQLNFTSATLEEIWRNADFITIHTPKTRDTTNLINKEVLSKIKPGVRIVNAARGGIIDEQALADAIKQGRVAGAALDVFASEPLNNSPLCTLEDKVILTPHIGASTVDAQFNVAVDLAQQIRDYLTIGIARSPVNLPAMHPKLVKSLGHYVWLAETMGMIASELSEGSLFSVEVSALGSLKEKDISPLVVSALKGILSVKVENVTHVNAELIAKNHGMRVQENKFESSDEFNDELKLTLTGDRSTVSIAGTVLSHNEPIISSINDYPIRLAPSNRMLFTMHQDQPGMVAQIAGILGRNNINISNMGLARSEVRQDAIMVMALDDSLTAEQVQQLSQVPGIKLARYICCRNCPPRQAK